MVIKNKLFNKRYMRLIKIGAEWCGPCCVMDKRLENFNACDYVKYDVDNEDEETLAVIDKYNVNGTISNQYAAARLENSSNIVEEDNKLAEEYSNPELYNEESNNKELPPAEEVVHTEEEIAAINPQTDNESEEFDKDSMEIIDENKPSIIRACDKNGNIIYYEVSADGKKKRVKREYAEAHM